MESGAGTSGLRAPGAPIPLHRRLHSTNFSREVATPILHSAEAQNGPSFDLDAALGPTSTQPYTAAGCRSRTGMTVTVTRHDDRLSRQIRGTHHDVSSYTGGMATAVPIWPPSDLRTALGLALDSENSLCLVYARALAARILTLRGFHRAHQSRYDN